MKHANPFLVLQQWPARGAGRRRQQQYHDYLCFPSKYMPLLVNEEHEKSSSFTKLHQLVQHVSTTPPIQPPGGIITLLLILVLSC